MIKSMTLRKERNRGDVKKKIPSMWTSRKLGCKLYALCLFAWFCPVCFTTAQNTESAVELREAQIARQAAEQRCAELGIKLVAAERELERERQKSRELQTKFDSRQHVNDQLQVRMAGLLTDQDEAGTTQKLLQAVAGMESSRDEQQRVCAKGRDFSVYLETTLAAVKTSEATKKDILEHVKALTRACDRLEILSPLVAGRGDEKQTIREYRVVSVNRDLGLVALDAGISAAVRSGSVWKVMAEDKRAATLQIVATRPTVSAAIVVEGSWPRITPGAVVRLDE